MTRPGVKVDIAFDSSYSTAAASRTWTDVTGYVFTSGGININHGRQDELTQAGANTLALTLDNRDGRFTPGLASSPYYPNVKIGRPIRVCANLCTHGDWGTFEANATGWSGANATVARTTAQAHAGAASLSVTATSATTIFAVTPSGTSGIPVAPSTTYRASAWVRSNGTSRTTALRLDWYDSAGALISSPVSSSITDSTTWQKVEFTTTSPANAAYVRLLPRWTAAAVGEVHYVDDVRLDVDRFTGYVDEWPVEWPHVVDSFATSAISATSRMARLGLSNKLRSVLEQEILADAPLAYYTLGEAEGATQSADSSGNGAAPLVPVEDAAASGYGDAADWLRPTFGASLTKGVIELGGLTFPAAAVGEAVRAMQASPAGALSVEVLFKAVSFGSFRADHLVRVAGVGGYADLQASSTGDSVSLLENGGLIGTAGSAVFDDLEVHQAALQLDGGDLDFYFDAALTLSSAGSALSTFGSVQLGPGNGDWPVIYSHVAVYGAPLSAARMSAHIAAAAGFAGETAADRLARYAGYAGIPAAEYSFSSLAVTPMAHIDTAGLTPVELMQKVAETDGGVLYDARDGVLTYVDRTVRYNATAALTLDAAAGEVEIGYTPKLDRSALINKVTASASDGTFSVTAENTTSSDEYGIHDPGDLELATTDDDEAHAAAWWRVNTYGEPSARAPQLSVELAKMTAARQAAVLAVDVGDKKTVTNLPSQSDESTKSFFVEGYTERITDSQWFIDFNASPAGSAFNVWTVEDPVYGAIDENPLAY